MKESKNKSSLLAGGFFSSLGDWFATVALMGVAFVRFGPVGVAAIVAARVAPRPLGALAAERICPRFGAQRVSVASLLVQGLAYGLLAFTLNKAGLAYLVSIVMLTQFFASIARPGILLLLQTSGAKAAPLLAKYGAANSAAMVLGPILGGLLALAFSAQALLLINGISFFFLAAALIPFTNTITKVSREAVKLTSKPAWLTQLQWGCVINAMVVTVAQACLPAIVNGNTTMIGIFYAGVGGGAMIGSLLGQKSHKSQYASRAIIAEGLLLLPLALFGASFISLFLLASSAAAGGYYDVFSMARVAREFSAEVRPQIVSRLFLTSFVGMVTGAAISLALLPLISWRLVLLTAGAVAIVLLLKTQFINKTKKQVTETELVQNYHGWHVEKQLEGQLVAVAEVSHA